MQRVATSKSIPHKLLIILPNNHARKGYRVLKIKKHIGKKN